MEGIAELLQMAAVIFGIGLVIFVHELGHFILARLCGVRVLTFSLGFGPRLLSWRRGSTTYQIAVVPLGGYVRMAGEERSPLDDPPAPDELPAKSVGQRFLIYSGGVVMNLLFGLVVFPILFYVGVPFLRPLLGEIEPGGPAWHAGLRPEMEVVSINGREVFDWTHIPTAVALAGEEPAHLVLRDPATGELLEHELDPIHSERFGFQSIGVGRPLERTDAGYLVLDAIPDTPAWEAGLRPGDRLVGVLGTAPGLDLGGQLDEVVRGSEPCTLLLEDEPGVRREITITPREEELGSPRVGILPLYNRVAAVRGEGLARGIGLRKGDRIVSVRGSLIQRSGDLRRALALEDPDLVIEVRRGDEFLSLTGTVASPEEALGLADDLAIGQDLEAGTIVVVEGEAGARAGLRDGDDVVRMNGTDVTAWDSITQIVRTSVLEERSVVFEVKRETGEGSRFQRIEVRPEASPQLSWGLAVRRAQYEYRADGFVDSLGVGATSSWRFLEDTWLSLKRMVMGSVSIDNMGGIITIGRISYSEAEAGWVRLFFFLCMLSINLAFLNALPIPPLDGGHLLFLLVEGIKGSPVSERVLGYSQMVGVVMILSLVIFVTYNDLVRWISPS
jgi:regulator of sigma E protease